MRRSRWITAIVLATSGCTGSGSHLRLESYKDPYFPETYDFSPEECVFRTLPDGDYEIVASSQRDVAGEDGVERRVQQYMHIHVFWRPRPGKTYDDPTTVDATLESVILTDRERAVYSGTAFVRAKLERSGRLSVRLERGRLRPALASSTEAALLGETLLGGRLTARPDASRCVALRRTFDRYAAGN